MYRKEQQGRERKKRNINGLTNKRKYKYCNIYFQKKNMSELNFIYLQIK